MGAKGLAVGMFSISLPSFSGLHCKLAKRTLFIYMMLYWVECVTPSVILFP